MVRATPPHRQVPPAGGRTPVEVAAPWPFTAALLDLGARFRVRSSRTFDRSAHQYFRSGSRDPPDLGANNPTRSGPCDPAAKPGFLSWGCPKIAPPSYRSRNPTPGDVLPVFPRGASFEMRTPIPIRVPPSWFCTTSAGYSSSTSRPYCRSLPILGFTAFPPVAKQDFPQCTCCPSMPSLRRQRRPPERILATVGSRHRLDRLRPLRSPRTLPSRPFSLAPIRPRFPAASSR